MRSASRLILLAFVLAGCATTQQEAARLQLNAARDRATMLAVHVRAPSPDVRVQQVALLHDRHGSAIVVRVSNLLSRPVTDLPLAVGLIGAHGSRHQLNGSANLAYFSTHLPALSPHGVLSWVFTTGRRLPAGARPYAEVGRARAVPHPQTLPTVTVSAAGSVGTGRPGATVANTSGVPQYQLRVYATVRRGGRYLAAGVGTIEDLTNGAKQVIHLRLTGRANSAPLLLQAPPTIFH